jgi:hypothetical protein
VLDSAPVHNRVAYHICSVTQINGCAAKPRKIFATEAIEGDLEDGTFAISDDRRLRYVILKFGRHAAA